jgi:hypothetical protein
MDFRAGKYPHIDMKKCPLFMISAGGTSIVKHDRMILLFWGFRFSGH